MTTEWNEKKQKLVTPVSLSSDNKWIESNKRASERKKRKTNKRTHSIVMVDRTEFQ